MKNYLITFLATLLSFSVMAQTVQVEKIQGPGITDSERFGLQELIEAEVSKVDGHYITKEKGQITLSPSVIKLGDNSFLKITITGEGLKSRSVKMKTSNFNDIDRVVSRLVTAALEEEEVESNASLQNITQTESNKYSVRYKARKQWIFGFGPTVLANSGTSKSGHYFNFGYNWQLDPNWSMQLTYDFASIKESKADFGMLAIGLNHFFTDTAFSPYFGVDFGYASADADTCDQSLFGSCLGEGSTSGWGASAKLGFQFFRTSTVNLAVETKYSHLFDRHSQGQPGRFTLSLSAYY